MVFVLPSDRSSSFSLIERSIPVLSLCMVLVWAGCTPEEPEREDDPTPELSFDPGEYELIEYELTTKDDEGYRGTDDLERVFHVQRFRLNNPMRIHALGAMFNVRGDDNQSAHLALYSDNGHNFFDFDRQDPMVAFDLDLNKADHDETWQIIPLPEPIDLRHPQLVYLGSEYRGEVGQPVLAVDEAISSDPYLMAHASEGDQFPPHIAVLPDRGTDANGFETVLFAGTQGPMAGLGDLMVRLYVESYDVTTPEEEWFNDETEDPTIGLSGSGSPSFGDCNDDGWEDVWDGQLHRNNGDGTFTNVTESSGITGGGAGAWADFNNDGHLDLFLSTTVDQLYEGQGDCLFVDVTAASGIDDTQLFKTSTDEEATLQNVDTPSAAWVDVDNDGLVDLMQANFMNFTSGDSALDYLWLNQGDGLFINGTDDAGMLSTQGAGKAGRGVAPADWDNDGDSDILISNYRLHRNFVWENEGSGDFENIARDSILGGIGTEVNSLQSYYGHTIGSAWGDLDGDGDLDLFSANLAHPRFIEFSNKSMLLRNRTVEDGIATFEDVAAEAGILYQETDSSPLFLDFDNDGRLDLFYTAVYPARPSYLYRNEGNWNFSMVSYPAGAWIYNGWGVSAADLDNDGDLDIYGNRLLRNEHPNLGGWIKVRVVGSGTGATNRAGLGVRLRVFTTEGEQTREVQGGVGVSSGLSLIQHFGLGDSLTGTIEVTFPATGTLVSSEFQTGQSLTIHEDGSVFVE